jgi:tetratricopeptide (TPR) repeat protein
VRRRGRWLVLAFGLALAVPARASEEPWRAARTHYEHGVELAKRGDYKAALEEFNAAYAASPHFAVLYNIGQAEIALGRPLQAIEILQRYLRDGKDDVPAERKRQVEAQLAQLASVFAELSIATDPPGAQISIDGAVLGRSPLPPQRLSAGSHVVTATRSNALPVTRVVVLKEGERQSLDLPVPLGEGGVLSLQCWELGVQPYLDGQPVELAKAGLGVPVGAGRHTVRFVAPGRVWQEQFVEVPPGVRAAVFCGTVASDAPRKEPPVEAGSGFPYGYALVGAGVVFGGVALGHYLWNAGRYRDWQVNQVSIDHDDSPAHYQRQLDNNELAASIDRASGVSVGLTVTAGVLVAGGVTWALLDGHGGAAQSPKKHAFWQGFPVNLELGRETAALSWSGAW